MESLRGHKRVLLDTSVWIYHFEQHPQFGEVATKVISDLEAGKFHGIASELTLAELLVRPLQLGRQDVADEYELLLSHFPNLKLAPVSRDILLESASLRAQYKLRTPDAILLATALKERATAVVTNDVAWKKIADIKVIVLADLLD